MDRMNIAAWSGPAGWLKLPIGGIGLSELGGIWANIDGTHIINLIALSILGIGASIIALWERYENKKIQIAKNRENAEIEIAEKRRASFMRVPQPPIIVSPSLSKEVKS